MKHLRTYLAALLLCCALAGLSACTPTHADPASSWQPEAPAQSEAPAVSPSPELTTPEPPLISLDPLPLESDQDPSITGDVPALQPDESAPLSYLLDGAAVTAEGLRHYSLQGYSIVYDPLHFTCQSWGEGESYWNSQGNYLSVSSALGLSLEDVVEGLRLQENIDMEAQDTVIGSGDYPARTLWMTGDEGIYRQFWVLDAGVSILLVEQSYDTNGTDCALLQAIQAAMLATIAI